MRANFQSHFRCLGGKRMHEIDPSLPSVRIPLSTLSGQRPHAAMLGSRSPQLPPSKNWQAPSPTCPSCGATSESSHHFPFMCLAYEAPRRILREKVEPYRMNFKGLDAGAGDGGSRCSRKQWGWGWLPRQSTLAVVAPSSLSASALAHRFGITRAHHMVEHLVD